MDNRDQHDDLPPTPPEVTEPGAAYYRAASSDFGFFHFVIDTVLAGDYVAYVAKRALDDEDLPEGMSPARVAIDAPGPRVTFLRKRRQPLLEMFLARLVDNFQKYLVDLVRAVLRSRPQMLSTRQQTVTLEELLKYDRMEDLVHAVIERRVSALSYEGFAELQAWCAERGLEIAVSDASRTALVELIATRNVIAHNRGLVDERYLKAVPGSPFAIGGLRVLAVDDFFAAIRTLHTAVAATDDTAGAKFGLPRAPFTPEPTGGDVPPRRDGDAK